MGTIVRTREEWLASHRQASSGQDSCRDRKIGDSRARCRSPAADRPLAASRSSTWRMCSPVRSLAYHGSSRAPRCCMATRRKQPDPVPHRDRTRASASALRFTTWIVRRIRHAQRSDQERPMCSPHSWRPGSLDRRGLSPAELARKRPRHDLCVGLLLRLMTAVGAARRL